ncbi:DinB family protein [Rhodalgimonas zhirmunskyi]|uniref:DinB family protein n=1 Tax=Rhodalgimonas zhirmunskyi TaxID=2964767 RepID=A0AAJ1U4D6_9RHOB|nr:DinB family protein [Rhodoalgimonas zhirmunskyi]MDQ2092975.1 DinB family protein [Rhodoalgimonas zhirmunskyi]
MISPDYVLMMARYNAWQNKQLIAAFKALHPADLELDRGGFFGSIRKTASHLLWGDMMWMARFDGGAPPGGGIGESTEVVRTREDWALARFRMDARILRWAEELRTVDLTGALNWYSGAAGQDMTRPYALCVVHMFNHQTHHRGQIHAMLTATDVTAPVTDLALMPAEGPWL